METITGMYMNSFGKVFNTDHQRREGYFYPQKDYRRDESEESSTVMAANKIPKKERNVSASIEVPNPSRRSHWPSADDHSMEDLMAAMVLSNMPYSPMLHSQYKEASPRSYDSSGVGSWSQDSRTSPFLPSTSALHPGLATPRRENDDDSPGPWRKSKTPDDISDTDPGTILLQRSTPKLDVSDTTDKEDEISDEPQDFSMKTLRAKEEAEERMQEEQKRQRLEELVAKVSKMPRASPGQYGIPLQPTANTLAPPGQIPFPYYIPNPLFQHPYAASLPNELLLRLANTFKPLPSPEVFGSSAPGHIDTKFHRYSRRPTPYNKISDDSAISSPLRSVSPATHPFGSAPAAASFRLGLPNSAPIPVSQLSFSPTRHRKMTRSPRPQCSPYSSPSHGPRNSSLSLPKDGILGMKSGREFHHQVKNGHGVSSLASKSKASSWNNTAPFAHHSMPNQPFRTGFYPKTNSAAPTTSVPIPFGRKVPGDGKKCRKVYGMENKDQWCTACKWKKACQRFPD